MIHRPRLRVIHCSDFHFDAEHRQHGLDVIKRLSNLQLSLGADVVLIAGDIFESTRQPRKFVEEIAEELLDFPAPIVAIPGNHDVVYDGRDPASELFSLIKDKGTYLSSPQGQTIVTADGRLRVWGRGMLSHSPDNDPLEHLEPMALDSSWNIVLAHGQLLKTRNGNYLGSPIVLADHDPAITTVDYVALGHHHYTMQTAYGRTVVRDSGAAPPNVGRGTVTLVDLSTEEGLVISSHRVYVNGSPSTRP